MTTTIHLRGLVKRFGTESGTRPAVDGLDLDIRAGEVVALLGPNGAGKTTTLDMVLGFTSPTSGTVQVLGGSPSAAIRAGRVAAVLQTGGLLRDLRIRETVELIASMYETHPSVDDVMARAGITDLAARQVQACSGGEQQRLRFALALLADPELLVLDEPTTGMDVGARQEFWQAMHAEADRGRTIVFATHYLEEAEQFAQRTILLAHGRVVADGPTERIRNHVGGRTVRATLAETGHGELVAGLRNRDDVTDLHLAGRRVEIVTTDSDAIARLLLDATAHDLEIEAASLEHAFLALTNDRPTGA
jgi:ABC-2 type transport system ATP-binding protein